MTLSDFQVVVLTVDNRQLADEFAEKMFDNVMFTHFRHTSPCDMLDPEKWSVWMLCKDEACLGWMQAQLFRGVKAHVSRLGLALVPELRGHGLGTEMIKFMVDNLNDKDKLTASAFSDNVACLRAFKTNGFTSEGTFFDEERWPVIGSRSVVSLARFKA